MKVDFAAAYCGEHRSTFLRRVDKDIYPRPIKVEGNSFWYIEDLDAALDDQKQNGELSDLFMGDIDGLAKRSNPEKTMRAKKRR